MKSLRGRKLQYIQLGIFMGLIAILALALLPGVFAADQTAGNEAELVTAINTVNAAGAGNHTITLTADITLTAPLPDHMKRTWKTLGWSEQDVPADPFAEET